MLRFSFVSLLAACAVWAGSLRAEPVEVDLVLVLAADNSGSVGAKLRERQRQGFVGAFRDPDLQKAVASGPLGRVAVIYFDWAGAEEQSVVVPWTVIGSAADMEAFAVALERAPAPRGGGETSISGAMGFAGALMETGRFEAFRKVLDLSGNGRNSEGPPVAGALRRLREAGVVVNGLVLPGAELGGSAPYGMSVSRQDGPLRPYFEAEVIGGPGAFAVVVDLERGFGEAILRKLVLEVAWAGSTADRY